MSQAPVPDPRREWPLPTPSRRDAFRPGLVGQGARARREWPWNLALFVATIASVWAVGGVPLAAGLISILFAHEMGHYLACRYYRVDATLPYFIPSPWIPISLALWIPLSFVGTFGALIRIKGRIPHRKALFDIGIAGPLAGFAVCLPVLYWGLLEARIVPHDPDFAGISLGEPLLFTWGARWLVGAVADGESLVITQLGMAAWFGLFVTALNLIPIGQLDGGHVSYALLRGRAAVVSHAGSWVCLALVYFGPNWLVWWALLRFLGRRHPPTFDDEQPVGTARAAVGVLGLAVFAVCFVPDPIAWSWSDFFGWIREATGL